MNIPSIVLEIAGPYYEATTCDIENNVHNACSLSMNHPEMFKLDTGYDIISISCFCGQQTLWLRDVDYGGSKP